MVQGDLSQRRHSLKHALSSTARTLKLWVSMSARFLPCLCSILHNETADEDPLIQQTTPRILLQFLLLKDSPVCPDICQPIHEGNHKVINNYSCEQSGCGVGRRDKGTFVRGLG